jgi:hypothetical protein
MSLLRATFICVAVIVVTVATVLVLQPDQEPDADPHKRPQGGVDGPGTPGDNLEGVGDAVTNAVTYVEAVQRNEHARALEYASAVQRARVAAVEVERSTAPVPASTAASPGQGGGGSGCVLPDYICERESGHDYGAVNPTGCGGRGCYGMYQFDPRTYAGAGCEGTAQTATPAQQDACAEKVYAGGAGASHWGY